MAISLNSDLDICAVSSFGWFTEDADQDQLDIVSVSSFGWFTQLFVETSQSVRYGETKIPMPQRADREVLLLAQKIQQALNRIERRLPSYSLSTQDRPIYPGNGAIHIYTDTGLLAVYNDSSTTWVEVGSLT